MSYTRSTDFIALLRDTGNGVRFGRMPGLDWLIAGLAQAGLFLLWEHPTDAPASNQTTTVWLKTSNTSWAEESTVWLWNAGTSAFVPATPKLWQALFAASA